MRSICEHERVIPIIVETDVLVAGGGTAGAVAAISAAREGANVVLIEQFGGLGGTATQSLVTPMMHTYIENNPMCSSISQEINDRLIESGYGYKGNNGNGGYFDPLMLKYLLEKMAVESGVNLLYYTFVSDVIIKDNIVQGLIIENKNGRNALLGKVIIDCTGDADLAWKAGVPCDKGDEDGKNQPLSLRYLVGGIDLEKFSDFIRNYDKNFRYKESIFYSAVTSKGDGVLDPVFKEAIKKGDLTEEDAIYWEIFGVPGRYDTLAFNCPEFFEDVDGTNAYHLTKAQIKGKEAIMRHLKFYKKYFNGFENAYVSEIAPMVGIRESRRIIGEYKLSDEDVLLKRKFNDYIAKSNYPVDIHGKTLKYEDLKAVEDDRPYYEIPYRCLLPVDIENMLVAGRCISASFLAQSSLRIQPTVRAIGEAAGIAAAIAVKEDILLQQIDGTRIREIMIDRGGNF